MKTQIGLIALTTLFISFVAFSGVASAQASNVQVVFFTSPLCSVCKQVEPLAQNAAAQYGVKFIVYDVSTPEGLGMAKANDVSGTPTIIISGAQPARFEGLVSYQQIAAAIKAAIGTATPTPTPKPVVKAAATATPKPVVKPVVKAAATATPKPVVKAAATATTNAKVTAQPTIEVATSTPTTSTQTVPEFSLLGLSAPALIVGTLYLFLRRR
jgi:thioredoxin-like negative regulator of GroEL